MSLRDLNRYLALKHGVERQPKRKNEIIAELLRSGEPLTPDIRELIATLINPPPRKRGAPTKAENRHFMLAVWVDVHRICGLKFENAVEIVARQHGVSETLVKDACRNAAEPKGSENSD